MDLPLSAASFFLIKGDETRALQLEACIPSSNMRFEIVKIQSFFLNVPIFMIRFSLLATALSHMPHIQFQLSFLATTPIDVPVSKT